MTATVERCRAEAEHVASRPRFMDHLDLAAMLTAVNCARVFIKITLNKWGAYSAIDDALLIGSELVTNAVKATGNTDLHPNWSALGKLNLIKVRLIGLESSILIEVWDTDPTEPVVSDAALDDEGGRGLFLIESITSRWGTYPDHGGKVVWAELPLYGRTASGLPRRRRSAASIQPPVSREDRSAPDAELLRRVRDGLREL